MKWFRERLRALATCLLVGLVSLGAWSTVVHGDDCHDADCALTFVVHDASSHAFNTAQPAGDAPRDHCILCHSVRTIRPSVSFTQLLRGAVSNDVGVHIADVRAARGTTAAQPPLRSPPISSVSVLFA